MDLVQAFSVWLILALCHVLQSILDMHVILGFEVRSVYGAKLTVCTSSIFLTKRDIKKPFIVHLV